MVVIFAARLKISMENVGKHMQVVIIATHLATIYLLSIPPNILQKSEDSKLHKQEGNKDRERK